MFSKSAHPFLEKNILVVVSPTVVNVVVFPTSMSVVLHKIRDIRTVLEGQIIETSLPLGGAREL